MHKIWLSSLGDMAARSWVMRKKQFWNKSGIMCVIALIMENLELIWEKCKHENYTLSRLEQDLEIW